MDYDFLIIGAGQGGVPLANTLHKAGKRVALAEKAQLGGSCVNWGCTPTKAFIASAKQAFEARRAGEYGVRVSGVEVDFAAVMQRAQDIANTSREGLQKSFEAEDSPALLRGHARFMGQSDEGFELDVGGQTVKAKQVILDTGSSARIPDIAGLDGVSYIDARNWLDLRDLPEHLAILGGGYIGLEMAQAFRRLGSEVTVIEAGGQLAGKEDEDVAEAVRDVLTGEGVTVHLNTELKKVSEDGSGVRLELSRDGNQETLTASHLFVAVGRVPNTSELGLDAVGVETNEQGYVTVDKSLRTSAECIWALGDIRGGPMFTHTSYDDFRVIRSALLGDGSHTTDRVVPYAMFTDPQLGRVGLSESQARERGHKVKIATYDMSDSGKAFETGHTRGFIKVVVDDKTDKLLGAAVLAAEGAELVHTYIALMNADAPVGVYEDGVPIHPTYNEALHSVLKDVRE